MIYAALFYKPKYKPPRYDDGQGHRVPQQEQHGFYLHNPDESYSLTYRGPLYRRMIERLQEEASNGVPVIPMDKVPSNVFNSFIRDGFRPAHKDEIDRVIAALNGSK